MNVTVISLFPILCTLAALHKMLVLDIHSDFPHPVRPTREAVEFAAKFFPKASTEIEPVNVLRAPHCAKPVDAHGESSQCSKMAAEWRGDGAEKRGAGCWKKGRVTCTGITAQRNFAYQSNLSADWNKNSCQHEQRAHSETRKASRFRRETRRNIWRAGLSR